MKVFVEDASLLLDLMSGDVLKKWIETKCRHFTTPLSMYEASERDGWSKLERLAQRGTLTVQDVEALDWAEIAMISEKYGISIADASVCVLAKQQHAAMLSNDEKVRMSAKAQRIEVHDAMWALQQLVSGSGLKPQSAARAIKRMLTAGTRLPTDECQLRIDDWTSQQAA